MLEKRYWQSKTIWVNILTALVCSLVPGAEEFISKHPVATLNAFCVLQVLLRKNTKAKVK